MNPLFAELVTHLIAFALFAWILKRYAWRPILDVMDRRRERIGGLIERAEEAEKEANATQERFNKKIEDLEVEADRKLQEAIRKGKKAAERLTESARKEAGDILAKARLAADRETQRAKKELQNEVAQLAVKVATQSLGDVVDVGLRKRLLDRATDHLAHGPQSSSSGDGTPDRGGGGPGDASGGSRKEPLSS